MRVPLIGITCGTKQAEKGPQDRLNQAYSRAVSLGGGMPVILPNLDSTDSIDAVLSRLDGIVLSGGADVDPAEFGQAVWNESVEVDRPRDDWELPLIRQAVRLRTPILAICRGIQSVNVALGGTLVQDLPTQLPTAIVHRQDAARSVVTHNIRIHPDSMFANRLGELAIPVNSFHHQAIDRLGRGLRVSAVAEDGVIEAVESTDGFFLLGVQYHPEELVEGELHARRLFEMLVEEAGT